MNLGELRSPELTARRRSPIMAVPLVATEQHGPHLPLQTDTTIAGELCRRLAHAVSDVVVAPAVPYGSSGEHAGLAGTLSIGRAALHMLVVELVRSADDFAGVVLVNAHGGNADPLRAAAERLTGEHRNVLLWQPAGPADDSHAGHTETSVMLRLAPEHVDTDAAVPGDTTPLPELLERLRTDGVAGVSPTGVLGDPTGASAAHGDAVLQRWRHDLVAAVTRWRMDLRDADVHGSAQRARRGQRGRR